ncbi:heterokaryon incompatibility protein-domain-containing protein, partial [Pyrenochaeta sp. MPI-SDFR-AT-0127]
YTPLANPNRQIRLLTIRAEKENDVELRCYLKTFESINDAPPYRALSYLWGKDDGEWKPKISLNKKNFEVGTNLHLALEHVGHMTFIGSPEWTGCWWIDAICIDQKNPHEKNEQIKIMKNIYENADEVVAWLG